MKRSALPGMWPKVRKVGDELRSRLLGEGEIPFEETELTPCHRALRSAADGDFQPLADYGEFGSKGKPPPLPANLSREEKLEQFLRKSAEATLRRFGPPPAPPPRPRLGRRGPPPDFEARAIVEGARQFRRIWRQRNLDAGIADRRHVRAMGERALEFILADYFPGRAGEAAKLLDLMTDRPKDRRAMPPAK